MRLAELKYKTRLFLRTGRTIVRISATVISFIASFCTLCLLIYEIGFQEDPETKYYILETYKILLRIFFYTALGRILSDIKGFRREKAFWLDSIILAFILLTVILDSRPAAHLSAFMHHAITIMTYILLSVVSLIQLSKQIVTTLQRNLKPEMMFAYSFLFIILTGTFLLLLPNAHHGHLQFIDALFTSTSAVCVTGLTVVETSSTFTFTGLIILATLIQIGGIGVMTFTSFFAMSFFCQVSFRDQLSLKNILNENSLSDIFRTLFYILLTTFIIETIGAYLIYDQIRSVPATEIPDKLFFAVFHSVSGFCNAGFSTLPGNLYDPTVRHLYGLQCWIALLVILGGIGFPILFNFGRLFNYHFRNAVNRIKRNPSTYNRQLHIISLTTRIVIPMTLILVIGGTCLFLGLEYNNTLKDLPFSGKLAISFMSAVTPRTAGFSSIDMASLLPPTIFVTMLLMWIGASPMSTGGGIKTTTFTIAIKNIFSVIRNKNNVEIARRQIPSENVRRAHAIILLSVLWIGIATLLLLLTENHVSVTEATFEVISAISTVGLTLGLTPELSIAGKIIISLTMFVGRVGLITLLTGIARQQLSQPYRYPEERVIL